MIDQAPQGLKYLRRAMHFIQNDQFVFVLGEVTASVCQLRAIGRRLQIEVERRPSLSDLQGQRRLAYLPRPQQSDGWAVLNGLGKFVVNAAFQHPCKSGT